MSKKPYTLTVGTEVLSYSSKSVAVKAGERTGLSFAVRSPKGALVHSFAAPVEDITLEELLAEADEIGNTIIGLPTVAAPKKACKKGDDHEFRITKSGSYCYTCDRVAAEAQKAARAAAKAMVADVEAHVAASV